MPDETIPIKRPTIAIPDFVANAAIAASQKQEVKYPTEVVPLPTKGWFYPDGHILSSGEIEIKQMTAKEEDILANQELIKKGKVLDKLLDSLVVNKEIKTADILIPDKNAIFVAIRRLAYGDDYPVVITCPQCNAQNKVKINLAELNSKPFNFDEYPKGQNSFAFKTPSGIELTYKLLCQTDESNIEVELAQLKRLSKDSSSDLTTRLKFLITSVNGNSDKAAIRKFVDSPAFSAKDSLALRKHMREHNPDIDMSFDFKCNECTYERRSDVPIGASFLWPDFDARG
jgi:hypothetical protein